MNAPADIVLTRATFEFGAIARPPRVEEVLRVVAEKHGVSVKALLSRARRQHVCRARAEAMQRLSRELRMSSPAIGHLFSRDHTTVLHALERTAKSRRALVCGLQTLEGREEP